MFKTLYNNVKRMLSLRSLRTRIWGIILVAGIVPCVLMRYGIVNNYEERAVDNRASTVQKQMIIEGNHLISNDYLNTYHSDELSHRASRNVINAELETISNLYDGRVMIIDKDFMVIKDTYDLKQGKTIISEEVIKCFKGENTFHYDSEHGYIEMTTPIISTVANGENNTSEIQGVMLTSISTENIRATMDILNRNALILEIIMIMVITAVSIVVSVLMTRPFNRITDAINDVKAGYSNEEISVRDYVETVHIVDAFNQLLKRMKALDDSRQEFVANVSHELKTPMTSIKVLADSLLSQNDVPAELYREFMEDMVSEIDRENQIITDLLALVKMDKKVQNLNIVSLNINDLTEIILKRLRPLARKKDVEVVFESARTVVAEVDEVKISLVMTNLVTLDADHQFFTFTVQDSGIGIPEDSMPHVYERFYRVDKSHSREIGGTGLGLAITKSAVLAHKGSITLESTLEEGTTFVVKIPLNYIA